MIRRALLAFAFLAGLVPAFAQAPPPVVALPDTARLTSYMVTGTTCACNVGFALYGDSTDYQNWIEVFLNGVRVNYFDPTFGWAITSPTGPIATIPRPITDAVLTFTNNQTGTVRIVGARRPRRTILFQENRGVPARDLNQSFNDIVSQNRETWDKINDVGGRVLLTQPGNILGMLPLPAACANMYLAFDPTGLNPICTPLTPSGGIPTNSVSNLLLAQMPAGTVKCNPTSLLGNVQDCWGFAVNNVQSTGQFGFDFSVCIPPACSIMLYTAPLTVAQNEIPPLRVQRNSLYTGGTLGNTSAGIWMLDLSPPNGVENQWSILGQQYNRTRVVGISGSQNVAVTGANFVGSIASGAQDTATVTITNASPTIVSWTGSNLSVGNQVYFKTTGGLPAPLATGTPYYVIATCLTPNSFEVSATFNGAAINTTTNGSGTQTGIVEHSFSWGGNLYSEDDSGIVNPTVARIGTEVGSWVQPGAGTDSFISRVPLSISGGIPVGTDAGVHIGVGILFTGGFGGITWDNGILFAKPLTNTPFGNLITSGPVVAVHALDTTLGTFSGSSIILAANQSIGLNAGDTVKLLFDVGNATLTYQLSGLYVFQAFNTGQFRVGQGASDPTGFTGGLFYNTTSLTMDMYNGAWAPLRTRPAVVTVASLPACNTSLEGEIRPVSDANSNVFDAAAAGGGTNRENAYCNSSSWRVH